VLTANIFVVIAALKKTKLTADKLIQKPIAKSQKPKAALSVICGEVLLFRFTRSPDHQITRDHPIFSDPRKSALSALSAVRFGSQPASS